MKKTIFFAGAMMLLASVACNKEAQTDNQPSVELKPQVTLSFNASLTTPTKTEIGNSETADGVTVHEIYWSKDDKIAVYPHDPNSTTGVAGVEFTSEDLVETSAAEAVFTGEIDAADAYYAFYPTTAGAKWHGGAYSDFSVTLPYEQTANGIASGFAVANVTGTETVTFDHVCGFVKFTIDEDYAGMIKEVRFAGKNSEALAGKLYVYPDDMSKNKINSSQQTVLILSPSAGETFAAGTYYFTCFPVNLTGGLELTFVNTDDEEAVKSSATEANIERAGVLNLGTVANLEFESVTPTIENGTYAVLAMLDNKYYYLTNEDTGNSTKRLTAEDSKLSELPSSFSSVDPAYVWMFTFDAGKYTMQDSEGLYMKHSSENSASVDAEGISVVVEENNGVYSIHYSASDAERYLSMINTGAYFVFYKSGVSTAIYDLYLIPATADKNAKITNVVTSDPTGLTATGGVLNGSYDGYNLDGAEITLGFELNSTTYIATPGNNNTFTYTIDGLEVDTPYTYKAWASVDGGTTKIYGEEKTITPEAPVATTSVSIDLTSQNYSNQQKIETISVDPITITLAQGTHSNTAPAYYTSTSNGPALRYYAGNTITFSGANIRKIEITAPSSSYCKLSASEGTLNVDGKVSTWEGNSENVVLSGIGSGRITSIVITYESN